LHVSADPQSALRRQLLLDGAHMPLAMHTWLKHWLPRVQAPLGTQTPAWTPMQLSLWKHQLLSKHGAGWHVPAIGGEQVAVNPHSASDPQVPLPPTMSTMSSVDVWKSLNCTRPQLAPAPASAAASGISKANAIGWFGCCES
jgi:hypothetical protein